MQTVEPVQDPLELALADRGSIERHLVAVLGLRNWQAQALTDSCLERWRQGRGLLPNEHESARMAIHLGMASEKVRRAVDWLRQLSEPCAD